MCGWTAREVDQSNPKHRDVCKLDCIKGPTVLYRFIGWSALAKRQTFKVFCLKAWKFSWRNLHWPALHFQLLRLTHIKPCFVHICKFPWSAKSSTCLTLRKDEQLRCQWASLKSNMVTNQITCEFRTEQTFDQLALVYYRVVYYSVTQWSGSL